MGKILTTFSGSKGDILWALPTVHEISKRQSAPVDLMIMKDSNSLLPLLAQQSYIAKAFSQDEWVCTGEPFGKQPWQSPNFPGREQYERVIDLTYREHPHLMPLAQWTAQTAGVELHQDWIPFLEVPPDYDELSRFVVSFNFNDWRIDLKMQFLEELRKQVPECTFIETTHMPFARAASYIKNSVCFVGCRSSNYVLACGVGQRCIIFEPHPQRGAPVFNCEQAEQMAFGPNVDPMHAATMAAHLIRSWASDIPQRKEVSATQEPSLKAEVRAEQQRTSADLSSSDVDTSWQQP